MDPTCRKLGCGVGTDLSIYKSSTYSVGNGVGSGVLVGFGVDSGVLVGYGVGSCVGNGVDVGSGVLVGTEVDVGIGVSEGVTSINFFFQGLPDPVLVV